jgi:hypothetical protein
VVLHLIVLAELGCAPSCGITGEVGQAVEELARDFLALGVGRRRDKAASVQSWRRTAAMASLKVGLFADLLKPDELRAIEEGYRRTTHIATSAVDQQERDRMARSATRV